MFLRSPLLQALLPQRLAESISDLLSDLAYFIALTHLPLRPPHHSPLTTPSSSLLPPHYSLLTTCSTLKVVGDLQLDSFSETASSPVLLYVVRTSASNSPADGGTEKEKGREKEKEKKKKNSRDRDLGQLAGDVDAK